MERVDISLLGKLKKETDSLGASCMQVNPRVSYRIFRFSVWGEGGGDVVCGIACLMKPWLTL